MTVGAAQLLLKAGGLLPTGRTVLIGAGPLVWLFAAQMIAGGTPPVMMLNTSGSTPWRATLPLLPAFLKSPYARKGISLVAKVKRSVPTISSVRNVRINRDSGGLSVVYRRASAADNKISADHVLLHQGVVPSLNLIRSANCEIIWDDVQACWHPVADTWGASSVQGIAIAGDGAGIAGAEVAARRGRIAALNTAYQLGTIDRATRDTAASDDLARIQSDLLARRFLDLAYRPTNAMRIGSPDAIVCRCEEVTGRRIREVVREAKVTGPNQLKAFLRCGMGPCQGRFCSLTVNEIIADERRVSPAEIQLMRVRPPIKPVTVEEFAGLET